MAKKKNTQIPISQGENTQAQAVFEHYRQIATDLHSSSDQQQAQAALTEISNLPEGAQLALLKALAKEQNTDAADVLNAINTLSPLKSVRKEARRSLLRLENDRIYPQWHPPVQPQLAVQVEAPTVPGRFWKGVVTDSRAAGEVQLLLCFEQEDDPTELYILGFLLEFWHDGVKDFFVRHESKRRFDNFATQMAASMPNVKTKDCSLAHGRRLLLDALVVNERFGTQPHKDYRANLSLVKQLVLEAANLDEDAEDDEQVLDLHGLEPQDVVINFIEFWADDGYGIAYDLLSADSPLREGLSRDEWVKRRKTWAEEAQPSDLEPNLIREREPQKPKLWLPNLFGAGYSTSNKEIETGWSVELEQIPLTTLPEVPEASAIYQETGRHWFWTSYTLVQEQGEWRIQTMTDETKHAQGLSVVELQEKIEELDKHLEDFSKQHKAAEIQQLSDEETQHYLEEVLLLVVQATYYTDALIKKLPLDNSLYEQAAGRMLLFAQYERCIIYLEALTQRFGEQRGLNLRRLAEVQRRLSDRYFDKGDDERAERCLELAEKALRESLTVENNLEAHISLAELLIDDKQLDEAKDHLLQAKALPLEPSDEAHVEMHLGEIATEQEQYREALKHCQRVVELAPDSADSWFALGEAHQTLKNLEEAETGYRRAIALAPDNEDYYFTLSTLYNATSRPAKAIETLEDGLSANPDSVNLNIALATIHLESGDYRQAELFLEKAEHIDPEVPLVQMFRRLLNESKLKQTLSLTRLTRPGKKRRR
jgi:tetratricopeptide (TPR) repeat protein